MILLVLGLAVSLRGGHSLGVGGYTPIDEIGSLSKVHHLATFAVAALQRDVCAEANSIVCARLETMTLYRVSIASSQVVSGVNYRIVCETSAGNLTLSMFEQVWTDTLVLNSASLIE